MFSIAAIITSALIGVLASALPVGLVVLASAAVAFVSGASGLLAGEPAGAIMRSVLPALLLVEIGYMAGASVQIFWHARNEPALPCEEAHDASALLNPDGALEQAALAERGAASPYAALSVRTSPPWRP